MVRHVVLAPVQLGRAPRWVRDSRSRRGLDPETGRTPGAGPSPVAAVLAALAVLGGIALFVWICVALTLTALS